MPGGFIPPEQIKEKGVPAGPALWGGMPDTSQITLFDGF